MTNYNNEYMMLRITGAYLKPNTKTRDGKEVIWRNFSGRPTNVNPRGGNRFFTIDLNRSQIVEIGNDKIGWRTVTDFKELADMGWKISFYDAREKHPERVVNDNYTPNITLNVVVSYEHRAPEIYQYIEGAPRLALDIDTISGLDNAWIDRAQIRLGHSASMTAYLNVAHIYLRPNNNEDWAV